ncbi:MAG: hypothetical protein RL385_1321 [Pseudomonadota bacterium]
MSVVEREIEFLSAGVRCRGLFVRPVAEAPAPLIVLAHGLGGIYEMRLDAYAREFAAAGYAALTFDYRNFGRSDGVHRHMLARAAQQRDIDAAIDFGKTLDGVDGSRVALWGTSLAGGHAIDVASRRGDLSATVIQAPFTDGVASLRATSLASALGTGAFVIADALSRLIRRKPVLVPLAATPWLPALMTKPDVVQGVLGLLPDGTKLSRRLSTLYARFAERKINLDAHLAKSDLPEKYDESGLVGSLVLPSGSVLINGVGANFGLEIGFWRPGKNLARLRAPVMVCVCANDTVAPPGPTIAYAKRAPKAEVTVYPYQHFEIYVGTAFREVVRDQIAFLTRVLPVAKADEDRRTSATTC